MGSFARLVSGGERRALWACGGETSIPRAVGGMKKHTKETGPQNTRNTRKDLSSEDLSLSSQPSAQCMRLTPKHTKDTKVGWGPQNTRNTRKILPSEDRVLSSPLLSLQEQTERTADRPRQRGAHEIRETHESDRLTTSDFSPEENRSAQVSRIIARYSAIRLPLI